MIWHSPSESGIESKRSRARRVFAKVVFGTMLATMIALVFGYFVMLLWNGVLPHVTAAGSLSYWQAVGLLVLARILVGGLKGHGHGHGHWHGRHSWREYDRWWQEVGRQSFKDFEGAPREPREK